ncbi:sulfatase [Candidatus Nanohalococcus occultus]|uniref:Choline-sulfatase n=1 Tax=Candidatus Nanohalococcus occultus TaxID=2978047 RepID=A0ABY8CFQ8_9ARCH|nr:Choline-sulfatase [Candidatus Nanohaloarchaeota archaeon SVXNc]
MKSFEESPNIVLLVMDTVRAQNVSHYTSELQTTPFFDKVAEEGVVFENAYANSIWTLPSHYSLFTGLSPIEHGVKSKEFRGRIDQKTLPEKLKDKGYQTVGVSNNGYVSPMYGFDKYFDEFFFNTEEPELNSLILFPDDKNFEKMVKGSREGKWANRRQKYYAFAKNSLFSLSPKSLVNGVYYVMTQKVMRSVDDGAQASNQRAQDLISQEPYFLFVNYVEAHSPYKPPREYARKFIPEEDIEKAYELADEQGLNRLRDGESEGKESELLEKLYNAEIAYLDHKVKELTKSLEQNSERETVTIMTSDHGEYFGENNLWEHMGRIGEEVLKVPLAIKNIGNFSRKEVFSLSKINDLVLNLSNLSPEIPQNTRSIAHYGGLETHQWDIDSEDFDEKYLREQVSLKAQDKWVLKDRKTFESEGMTNNEKDRFNTLLTNLLFKK